MRRFLRAAFTLVELLVVIAIIGVLVALLLPAVQSAREAARRSQCTNHVKHMAIGSYNYMSTIKAFPGGGWGSLWVGDPDRGSGGADQPGGWFYQILPFIEQGPLHDMGLGMGDGSPTNPKGALLMRALQTPVAIYACPTRGPAQESQSNGQRMKNVNYDRSPTGGEHPSDIGIGFFSTDYAVNGGTRPAGWGSGPGDHDHVDSGRYSFMFKNYGTGLCNQASKIGPRQITDGLSKTMLLGEKYINPDNYHKGWDGGADSPFTSGDERDHVRYGGCTSYLPQQDTPRYWGSHHFGGPHPGVCIIAFCDGSVQNVSYDVEEKVWAMQANRQDNGFIDPKIDAGCNVPKENPRN